MPRRTSWRRASGVAAGAAGSAQALQAQASTAQAQAERLAAAALAGHNAPTQVALANATANGKIPPSAASAKTRAADASDGRGRRPSRQRRPRQSREKPKPEDPAHRRKPNSQIQLKTVKMWSPRPGQKFNLATNLNIVFPKDMKVVAGTQPVDLTDEQLAQIMALMAHQHLEQVTMDRNQVRQLAELRRKATSGVHRSDGKDDKKDDAGGASAGSDERKREAERRLRKRKRARRVPPPRRSPSPKRCRKSPARRL